jgi:hypothetical protein
MTVRTGTLRAHWPLGDPCASATQANWVVGRPALRQSGGVSSLPLLAPLFLLFEVWQLAIGERYVGLKQIARGTDPRDMGPGEAVAFFWSAALILYGAWALALLGNPMSRAAALCLIATTAAGYTIRRNCGLKRILIVMTIEGGARIGFLFWLSVTAWHRA